MATIQEIAEHDSWISVDPIVGCAHYCEYCYLGKDGLRRNSPRVQIPASRMASDLKQFLEGRGDLTPIAIGNYTDMGLRANHAYAADLIGRLASFTRRPIVIVTKTPDVTPLQRVLQPWSRQVIFFFSQSFARASGYDSLESSTVATSGDTMKNFDTSRRNGFRSVHFWRPFLCRLNPLSQLPERVAELQAAGSLGSVVVGYKAARGAIPEWSRALDEIVTDADPHVGGDERISLRLWQALSDAASAAGYPAWRGTSCSLAFLQKQPDMLSTYEGWRAPHYCLSTTCPEVQRERCFSHRDRLTPPSLSGELRRPTSSIGVRDEVLTRFTHTTGARASSETVLPTKAWIGSATQAADERVESITPPSFRGNPALHQAARRLAGITGFLTTLHTPSDPRASVFARLDHLERVSWVAESLDTDDAVKVTARELIFLHDLNRWPFAHNLEKGVFSQGDNVHDFLLPRLPGEVDVLARELRHFHNKSFDSLTIPGRVALIADMVTGLIEDPLFLVAGLRVTPSLVPHWVGEALSLPTGSRKGRSSLSSLARTLHVGVDPVQFREELNEIFRVTVGRFVGSLGSGNGSLAWFDEVVALSQKVRSSFLEPVVFPINNDTASRAQDVRRMILNEFLPGNKDALHHLLTWDEDQLVAAVLESGLINGVSRHDFAADIDVISKKRPDLLLAW